MKKKKGLILITALFNLFIQNHLISNIEVTKEAAVNNETPVQNFTPFTGKICKNKVRMRLAPTFDSPIIKQYDKGEMLIVTGEEEDFYLVQAPEDMKAYIYRTFVLDGVVEGNDVNVRLEPSTESFILTKVKQGEIVNGKVSSQNNKWLEINVPSSTKFFINKELIEKVGDQNYLVYHQKKKEELKKLFNQTLASIQKSEKENFQQIDYEGISNNLKKISSEYSEFEKEKTEADRLLISFNDNYAKRKLEDLERRSKEFSDVASLQKEKSRLSKVINDQKHELEVLNKEVCTKKITKVIASVGADVLSVWMPKEESLYEKWKAQKEGGSWEAFYNEQVTHSDTLVGKLELYQRKVSNKPGDYVLLNSSNMPIAYLYSTMIDLKDHLGKKITINASKRPNNDFAYPAYFVLKIKDE